MNIFYVKMGEYIDTFVREKLAHDYDIENEYPNYRGLCDKAALIALEAIKQINDEDIKVNIHHGELAHSPKIKSKYWCLQHTWIELIFDNDISIYLDPTCDQFETILDGLFNMNRLSMNKNFDRYLDDMDNPAFSCKHQFKTREARIKHIDRVQKFQYKVLGKFSDMINKWRYS